MVRLSALLLVVVVGVGCASAPGAPSMPMSALGATGQSNMIPLVAALEAQYHGPVVGAWDSGLSIAYWSPVDRMWAALAPTLHQPLRAFVYWQGESDCDGLATRVSDYAPRFADLMMRVRSESGQPGLFVVVVRIWNADGCASIRQIQHDWIAADGNAVEINQDDLPHVNPPVDWHITPAGAATVAARVLASLR